MENNLYNQLLNATSTLLYDHSCQEAIRKLENEKIQLQSKIVENQNKAQSARRQSVAGFMVPGIILLVVGGLLILSCLLTLVTAELPVEAGEEPLGIESALVVAVMGIAMALPALGFGFFFIKKAKAKRERIAVRVAMVDKECAASTSLVVQNQANIDKQIMMVKKERTDFRSEILKATEFLPVAYSDLYSVSYLLMLVANGRCDTLKEAINMYELERRHNQTLSALQVIALKLDSVNRALIEVKGNLHKINKNVDRVRQIETIEFLSN